MEWWCHSIFFLRFLLRPMKLNQIMIVGVFWSTLTTSVPMFFKLLGFNKMLRWDEDPKTSTSFQGLCVISSSGKKVHVRLVYLIVVYGLAPFRGKKESVFREGERLALGCWCTRIAKQIVISKMVEKSWNILVRNLIKCYTRAKLLTAKWLSWHCPGKSRNQYYIRGTIHCILS